MIWLQQQFRSRNSGCDGCDSTTKNATRPSIRRSSTCKYGNCNPDGSKQRVGQTKRACRRFSSEKRYLPASTITSKNHEVKRTTSRESNNAGVVVRKYVVCRYLGMQFGGVRSTSQVANNFIGTGRVAGAVTFVRSAIFSPGGCWRWRPASKTRTTQRLCSTARVSRGPAARRPLRTGSWQTTIDDREDRVARRYSTRVNE